MKSPATITAGIIALLLLFGDGGAEHHEPPTIDTSVSVRESPLSADDDAPVPVSLHEPEPAVVVDDRPEMRMYSGDSCIVCEQLLREIEAVGGLGALPFRLVECEPLPWMETVPWFYWTSDQSDIGWFRRNGCDTLNGKRLDFLLGEWYPTQPEDPPKLDENGLEALALSQQARTIGVCCCSGSDTAACLCLEEIRAGIERGPCSCTRTWGSRHYMDGDTPVGPAGGYREVNRQQPRQRVYCPT